jgi:hypothetical protein
MYNDNYFLKKNGFMNILHINKQKQFTFLNKHITRIKIINQNKIENKSKTKNYLAKENKQKKTNFLSYLLESLFVQAPSSSLQKRRKEGNTNQRGSEAMRCETTR